MIVQRVFDRIAVGAICLTLVGCGQSPSSRNLVAGLQRYYDITPAVCLLPPVSVSDRLSKPGRLAPDAQAKVDALAAAGLLQKLAQGPNELYPTYAPTQLGRSSLRHPVAPKREDDVPTQFCGGRREVIDAKPLGEPTDGGYIADSVWTRYSDGGRVQVSFRYRFRDLPEWVRHTDLLKAYPDLNQALATDAATVSMVYRDGRWEHPDHHLLARRP